MSPRFTRCWLVVAQVVTCVLPSVALGGANAGATADLSWDAASLVVDRQGTAGPPFRLYLRLHGLRSVSSLALTIQWASSDSTSQYTAQSDSSDLALCGGMVHVSPSGGFSGDSSYDWITILRQDPPACVGLEFQPPPGPLFSARFCLTDAQVQDASGQVDHILVTNSVTVDGGGGLTCPPGLYAATPGLIAPSYQSLHVTPSLHSSTLYSAPLVTVRGNALDSVTGVMAVGPEGTIDSAVVASKAPNIATVAFPTLDGQGPWSLLCTSPGGTSDTLRGALALGNVPSVRFVPIVSLGASWHLPNTANEAWSPTGAALAVLGPDGLYVLFPDRPAAGPTLALRSPVQSFAWSPDGEWLLCRTQTDVERQMGLYSLTAVPAADSTAAVTMIQKADIGPFVWTSSGQIYYWEAHRGMRAVLDPPLAWQAAHSTLGPPRAFLAWVRDSTGRRSVMHRVRAELAEDSTLSEPSPDSISLITRPTRFPDGQRFLVTIFPRGQSPYSAIIDLAGRLVRHLEVSATSVSPDGRFILAHDEIVGQPCTTWRLRLVDSREAWSVPIDNAQSSWNAQFSPRDYIVTFEDPCSGGVYVGSLDIAPR